MKTPPPNRKLLTGASLVEVMVSIGVLAVVAPLALAAMLASSDGGNSSRAETRGPLIVENCMSELDLARKGIPATLPALVSGQEFGRDSVICLAFAGDGRLLGRVEGNGYETGLTRHGNENVSYLARLEGVKDTSRPDDFPTMLRVKIKVEYPAAAPAPRRRSMDFFTKLP